jgi:phosphatidylinositol-3-phosphatase
MVDAAPDIRARFTLITPNLCDDGHDCSTATADHWLSVEVPLILASPEYQSGTTAAFITWDENDAGGTVVPTYVVAPSVPPGIRVAAPFSHYSLLRSSEEMLGVGPLLGAAAGAPSMRGAFHI